MASPTQQTNNTLDFSNQVLSAFLRFAKRDPDKYSKLIQNLNVDEEWIQNEVQWHSVDFNEKFLNVFEEIFGPTSLQDVAHEMYSKKSGYRLGESALGLLIRPNVLFSQLGRMVRRMNLYNTMEYKKPVVGLLSTSSVLVLKHRDPHRHAYNGKMCDSARASIEGMVHRLGYRLMPLTEDRCVKRGDTECHYRIEWVNRISLGTIAVMLAPLLISLLAYSSFGGHLFGSISLDFFFLGIGVIIPTVYFLVHNHYEHRLHEAFSYQQDTLDHLRKMLERQRELSQSLLDFQEQYQRAVNLARIGEISYGIIHDMASPITVIQMGSGTLNDKLAATGEVTGQEVAKVFNVIKRSTDRLVKLQNLLRKTVKSEYSNQNVSIDVPHMIEELMALFETIARHKHVEMVKEIDLGTEPTMMSSEYHLERCLANALQNALNVLKNSPVKKLTIRAFRKGDDVVFEVKDTGPGFPEAMRKNLFAQFGQSHNSTGDINGSGYGLYSMKKLIEEINGKIEIDTDSANGTCIRFIARDAVHDSVKAVS